MIRKLPITVIIPTYKRIDQLTNSIQKIYNCNPIPDEIIVHIDAGDTETENILSVKFSNVVILKSFEKIGPGGGRNKCIIKASNNLIASFDDDSYPIDRDYFSELLETSILYPNALVIEAKIYHLNEPQIQRTRQIYTQHNFTGCGCAYHKDVFLKTDGFVPKAIAYGLEEVDLSLKAFQFNYAIIHNTQLRVLHNTDLAHHSSAKINAGAITNQALFTYLRYPASLYIRGFLQVANRVVWAIKNKRFSGILTGVLHIPHAIYKFREFRKPIPATVIKSFFEIRNKRRLIS